MARDLDALVDAIERVEEKLLRLVVVSHGPSLKVRMYMDTLRRRVVQAKEAAFKLQGEADAWA